MKLCIELNEQQAERVIEALFHDRPKHPAWAEAVSQYEEQCSIGELNELFADDQSSQAERDGMLDDFFGDRISDEMILDELESQQPLFGTTEQ